MYLLVQEIESDHGYDYEDTTEFDSYAKIVEFAMSNDYLASRPILAVYEVAKKYSGRDVIKSMETIYASVEAAKQLALAKLTPEDIEVLGL